ncbi:ATP-binding protein [Devosia nitrariae]|uniref:histidine kinase n=1 Tax=Devosia nitrariae TaxID=2071872 RepID=A0ABQ5W4M6_9HYPH|nr:ATP-binding protein [Devosia nitrariae]GLQ54749.1 sensor histidine kinase [Devosia nitrariae]
MLVGLIGLAVALLCIPVWLLAIRNGTLRAERELQDRLTISLRAVESEIERFRYLPGVVGQDGRIRAHLRGSDPPGEANRYLQAVREMSGADEIYVLDTNGLTLAASNWSEPGSFVGNNYSFRPYFSQAIASGEGRYYAVGVTTGIPGYFLSERVDDAGEPIGVVVVKVDMSPLEQAWAKAGEMTGIADGSGIVFLAGNPTWRYRPLYPLSAEAGAVIAEERTYEGIDVVNRPPLASAPLPDVGATGISMEDGDLLVDAVAVEPDGWLVFSALPLHPVNEEARLVTTLAALTAMLVSAVALFLWQRRQLTRIKLEQNAVLERRVAERTRELAHEIEVRKRAETELRETHDSLIHAARLAALGRMSTAIVHEVSQPLAALDSRLAAAGLHAERNAMPEVRKNLQSGRDLLKRMKRTVTHLKTFSSRQDPVRPEPVDIAQVVEAVCDIVEPKAREAGIALDVGAMAGLPAVAGNPIRLEQVFINLMLNAIDATRAAGNDHVSIAASSKGTCVAVEIADTGAGIPEDVRERIFEPFFTTKTTGEGLGLGLSITRTIIEEYGATLSFASRQEGGGTLTTVELPVHVSKRQAEPVA